MKDFEEVMKQFDNASALQADFNKQNEDKIMSYQQEIKRLEAKLTDLTSDNNLL